MASKTIRIDLFHISDSLAQDGQVNPSATFIKRVIPKPFDINKCLNAVRKGGISDETAELIETHVRTRRRRARCHTYFEIQLISLVLGLSASLQA